jgi:ABC-2 type transport system permease protein
MFRLELQRFLRSRIAVIGLSVLLLAGVISILAGRQHLDKHTRAVALTEHHQQQHIQRNLQFFNKEMGLLLYYLRFGIANNAGGLNALSIGQRDVNSSVQSITIRGLENQRYDTDLFNPAGLLAGNLDFNFVLIYLFPLLIIAFTYNLVSEEKEGGTWKLLHVQSGAPLKLIARKLLIRMMAVYAVLAILLVFASLLLPIQYDQGFAAMIAIAVLYLLSWFAICIWMVSLQQGSSVNAAGLLSSWILFMFILPGLVNNYLVKEYAVPEALSTVVEQREGYHEKWDMEKNVTMEKFYSHYPQFKKYGIPEAEFSWLWYYAMQQMGDDDAQEHTKEMQQKLWQREAASERIAWFIPSLHAQHQFNTVAGSGLRNYLLFLESTAGFHEKLRLHFYPMIFENKDAKSVDWKAFKMETFIEPLAVNWASLLLPFMMMIMIFTGLGIMQFKRKVDIQ